MKNKKRIIVAHPGKQHSYRTMIALQKAGYDVKYITTVYDKDRSLTRLIKSIFLKGESKERAESRSCEEFSDGDITQFCEFSSLVTLLLLRIDKRKHIYRVWNNHVFNQFGRKVANYAIKNKYDAVIMYDANAYSCFERLSRMKSGITKILDVSIAARPYQKAIYEEDMAQGGLYGVKVEQSFLWRKRYQNKYRTEIKNSDFFVCPSEFVKKSLIYCGVAENQIIKVPYGVDNSKFEFRPRKKNTGALRLVVAGQVNYRKGMHHLFKVLERFSSDEVKLVLFGQKSTNDNFFKNYSNNPCICFKGYVTQDELIEAYADADVYVLPSLCEGLSLSVLEAMSCGLPVIVSSNTGANDLIEEYVTGIVYEAGNLDELESSIKWYLNHRERIADMGEKAHLVASEYNWNRYYSEYARMIEHILHP